MTNKTKTIGVFLTVIIILLIFSFADKLVKAPAVIRIGSKNFTEQIILGEIMSQLINERLNIPIEEKFNLGGTFVCFNALKNKELDLYVEYTGTGLTAILNQEAMSDPQKVFDIVEKQFREKWNMQWLKPLGFNNTYTLTMRKQQAEELGIETITDLEEHKDALTAGFNHEFLERPDGYRGLTKHYGFEFEKEPLEMDSGLMYRAIAKGDVDVICGFATDGRIPAFNLTMLEDDKEFFPPYEAAPVVHSKILKKYPELKNLLEEAANTISDKEMAEMNYRVDEQDERPSDVAAEFLISKNLISKTQEE